MLSGKLLLEAFLLSSLLLELDVEITQMEVVAADQQTNQQQDRRNDLDRPRPGTQVVHVQLGQIHLLQAFDGFSQTHGLAPSFAATGCVCCTVS